MIKLTLNPESNPVSYLFDKESVTIGTGATQKVDLQLRDARLQSIHIEISREKNLFLILNAANDPFVTLNGLPFGKKLLTNQDILQIGQTLISFEGSVVDSPAQTEPKTNSLTNSNLFEKLESLINSHKQEKAIYADFDLEKELRNLDIQSETWQNEDFDQTEERTTAPSKKTGSKPDVDLITQDSVQENKKWNYSQKKVAPPLLAPKKNSWKLMLALGVSILALITITLSALYVNMNGKTEVQEITAAKGISDVAMALTYAQTHHLNPQTQNWSNPGFLKNSLSAIMSSDYISLANIDTHGHFTDTPYILRIYTNSNFSRFLVIALPVPSLLQWLIPKKAIVVDSENMKLHMIQDLRALNRLLVNPNTLEGANGTDITNLVKRGVLLPLSALAEKTSDLEFSPPRELSEEYPGAENYIYNAPRYYQFGETYMQKALSLTKNSQNASFELAKLQQDTALLLQFPMMVFYSPQSLESAVQEEKALMTFAPQLKFLMGYLKFNGEEEISGAYLLRPEDRLVPPVSSKIILHSLHPDIYQLIGHNLIAHDELTEEIDEAHPLFFQLLALSHGREQKLSPVAERLTALLKNHLREYSKEFEDEFEAAFLELKHLDHAERQNIGKDLYQLYEEYASMPFEDILPFAKAVGLDAVVEEAAAEHQQIQEAYEFIEEVSRHLQDQIKRI